MSDALRRHGLESFLANAPAADNAGVSVSVRGDLGIINLRGSCREDSFLDAAAEALGQALPLKPNTFTADAQRIYWLGPDEWLVVCPAERAPGLARSLESALSGHAVAINDLSGGYVVMHLAGSGAGDLLVRGCTLDLHPDVFPAGSAAQTGLAKASVLIGAIDDAPGFEIVVRRSFADYLVRWIAHVGRHFGVAFAP